MPESKALGATANLALGVDVGGTKVAAGLVDTSGNIVFQTRAPMAAHGDAAAGLASVREAIDAVFGARPDARRALAGIGICAPGPLDPRTGVILNPPNVPCWRNYPLAAEVQKAFGLPVRVDNDAKAAALAEALWGAGVGYRIVFYATLGTGIGTGVIFDKRIYHGRTGSATEGGHVTIDYHGPRCNCGKLGCIEILCSGNAIAKRARGRLSGWSGNNSKLLELAGGNIEQVQAETVGEAYRQGDALARAVLEETADLLAIWLGNMIDFLEPEVMILGGGVSDLMGAFFGRIQEGLPRWCINPRCREIPLLPAKYGHDAGIAGAAALCRME